MFVNHTVAQNFGAVMAYFKCRNARKIINNYPKFNFLNISLSECFGLGMYSVLV